MEAQRREALWSYYERALPNEEQRDAFLLQTEGGLTLEQIAEVTGTGRETVKSRLRYALRRLRAGLEDCDE